MGTTEKIWITVSAHISAPLDKVWAMWNGAEHIVKWNFASDDWHTTKAENDLKVGGKLQSRMEAKDGSMGFDFVGVYTTIKPSELIEYTIADGRKVKIVFTTNAGQTHVVESFEAETENSVELQQGGWQAILTNFKKYVESH